MSRVGLDNESHNPILEQVEFLTGRVFDGSDSLMISVCRYALLGVYLLGEVSSILIVSAAPAGSERTLRIMSISAICHTKYTRYVV